MSECKQCPHVVGNLSERDCEFPDCLGWHIQYNPKPIPIRICDYDFWHNDADVDNGLYGTAKSVEDAMNQIAEIEANRE